MTCDSTSLGQGHEAQSWNHHNRTNYFQSSFSVGIAAIFEHVVGRITDVHEKRTGSIYSIPVNQSAMLYLWLLWCFHTIQWSRSWRFVTRLAEVREIWSMFSQSFAHWQFWQSFLRENIHQHVAWCHERNRRFPVVWTQPSPLVLLPYLTLKSDREIRFMPWRKTINGPWPKLEEGHRARAQCQYNDRLCRVFKPS